MDSSVIELSALGFQAVITALLASAYFALWRQQRHAYFGAWAAAWALYAARIAAISAFLITRQEFWLFVHQALAGWIALLLLWAAMRFSRRTPWRPRYLWWGVVAVVWACLAIYVIRDMRVTGITAVAALSLVTLWTGVVFWGHRRRARSTWATVLAVTFLLWGLHHLDYPLLRPLGAGALYGVFVDVLFIVTAAV